MWSGEAPNCTEPVGFFVGELDGNPIASFSAVKYSSDIAFLGSYIVDKQYRGKGYGLQMFTTVLDMLGDSFKLAADSAIERENDYHRFGLKPYWEEIRYEFVACETSKVLATDTNEPHKILPLAITTALSKYT